MAHRIDPAWIWDQYWVEHRNLGEIADEVGVSTTTLYNWFQRWGFPTRPRGSNPSIVHSGLSDDDIRTIKARVEKGESQTKLAKEFKVSRQRIHQICSGVHRRLVA